MNLENSAKLQDLLEATEIPGIFANELEMLKQLISEKAAEIAETAIIDPESPEAAEAARIARMALTARIYENLMKG